MIAYLDTSAIVPLLVAESSSTACGELWDNAEDIIATRLVFVEAAAAVGAAERLGRITPSQQARGLEILDELWRFVSVVELQEQLMLAAAEMAGRHGLRGYDAVHCAAAVAANDELLVAASGDQRLLEAWNAEGVAVRDTNA